MVLSRKVRRSIIFAAIGFHLASLYVIPWINGDWGYVQTVWDRWQGIIVGDIAFLSSYIFFLTTRDKEDLIRKKRLKASRSNLPKALSGLIEFYMSSFPLISEVWKMQNASSVSKVSLPLPSMPIGHDQIFHRCIEYEDNFEISDHLIKILNKLQINYARLCEFKSPDEALILSGSYIASMSCEILESIAMINLSFDYARGEKEEIRSTLYRSDLRGTMWGLDVEDSFKDEINKKIDSRYGEAP